MKLDRLDKFDEFMLPTIVEYVIGGENQLSIDARELHKWLKNGDHFATWIKSRIKTYGFVENEDFSMVSVISEIKKSGRGGNRRSVDYMLTLDTAKELSMLENNEQGRFARRYFIKQEKVANHLAQSNMVEINKFMLIVENFKSDLSSAARFLVIGGKHVKPRLERKLSKMIENANYDFRFNDTDQKYLK